MGTVSHACHTPVIQNGSKLGNGSEVCSPWLPCSLEYCNYQFTERFHWRIDSATDAAAEMRPVFVEPLPQSVRTSRGSSATIFCRVRSYTKPLIQVNIIIIIIIMVIIIFSDITRNSGAPGQLSKSSCPSPYLGDPCPELGGPCNRGGGRTLPTPLIIIK